MRVHRSKDTLNQSHPSPLVGGSFSCRPTWRSIVLHILLSNVLFLSACRSLKPVQQISTQSVVVNDSLPADSMDLILTLIRPYKDSLTAQMDEVVANSSGPFTKELPESTLGNLCADICMEVADSILELSGGSAADFCFLNNGGLRSNLPAGNINLGNVFELMPFENELVTLEISKSDLDSLLNMISAKGGAPVSGVQLLIKEKRTYQFVLLSDPENKKQRYTIVTSDFLAHGGDGYTLLKKYPVQKTAMKVRDAFTLYFRKSYQNGKTLQPVKDGRIKNL